MTENSELAFSDQINRNKRGLLGQRHIVTFIGFLCCFFIITNRLVLSVGIVAMVKHRQENETSTWNISEISCPLPSAPTTSVVESNIQGEFDWSSQLQGYVLGAGLLSCIIVQIPAGRISDAIGSKSLLVYSNAMSGLLTAISPVAARWDIYALFAAQFLRGVTQGIIVPTMYRMMSNWIPRNERGKLNSFAMCGYTVGVAVGGVITGWLCDIPSLGWPFPFYFWGVVSILFAVVIQFIYHEHPSENPWIKDEELKYITDGLETEKTEKPPPTPWKKIFSSVPSYAYFYGLFGHFWESNYFFTVHPTYMGTILHYSIFENGIMSCLPALIATFSAVLTGVLSHWISKKNLIGLNNLRKTATAVSAFGYSICMAGILLAGCDTMINFWCFALKLFFLGIAIPGICISGIDMSPVFAGSLNGVAFTFAGIGGFLVPIVTGLLTTHETLNEWQAVFWVNIAIVGSSGLVYVIFGSAEMQPWNYPEGIPPTEVKLKERTFSHSNKPV